jgi:hypothetical protein
LRPGFPIGKISAGHLNWLDLTVPGVVNGLMAFPTVFYGFKKQSDGTFAEPFKLAFNDAYGANGPYGLSFQMTSATTAKYVVSWYNYFDDVGNDGKFNIYNGTVDMGQTNNMGDVVYSGDAYQSISPHITPVNFASHAGTQGNPHIYYDTNGVTKSIWTDAEDTTRDLTVYSLASGSFPNGTWTSVALASKVNTVDSESQPFFTGTKLFLNREVKIVSHNYLGSGGADYQLNASWGNETLLLQGSGNYNVGDIWGVGEPTIATVNGKNYLYFVYILVRGVGVVAGRYDLNMETGFVEIP